jgi:hypothetical protein
MSPIGPNAFTVLPKRQVHVCSVTLLVILGTPPVLFVELNGLAHREVTHTACPRPLQELSVCDYNKEHRKESKENLD